LAPEPLSITRTDMEMQVRRVVHWYLMQEQDSKRRATVFGDAVTTSGAILIPGLLTASELDRKAEGQRPEEYLFSEKGARVVADTVSKVIRQAADNGALGKHPRLARALFGWRNVATDAATRDWVTQFIETPEGTLALLVGTVQRGFSQTAGERIGRLNVCLYLEELKTFV